MCQALEPNPTDDVDAETIAREARNVQGIPFWLVRVEAHLEHSGVHGFGKVSLVPDVSILSRCACQCRISLRKSCPPLLKSELGLTRISGLYPCLR